MEGFVKGDIIIINFPYSDLTHYKKRPALIIKVPKGDDLIVCQITGSSYEPNTEIVIELNDFSKGNLKRKNFARIDKISIIEKSLILYRAGSLKEEKFNFILNKICEYLKN